MCSFFFPRVEDPQKPLISPGVSFQLLFLAGTPAVACLSGLWLVLCMVWHTLRDHTESFFLGSSCKLSDASSLLLKQQRTVPGVTCAVELERNAKSMASAFSAV